MLYTIVNGECTQHAISGPMERACVPNNSTFMHAVTIGETLRTRVFKYEDSNVLMDLSVTHDRCIPVSEVFVQRPRVSVVEYFDFVEHLPHEHVFEPPSICKPASGNERMFRDLEPAKVHNLHSILLVVLFC